MVTHLMASCACRFVLDASIGLGLCGVLVAVCGIDRQLDSDDQRGAGATRHLLTWLDDEPAENTHERQSFPLRRATAADAAFEKNRLTTVNDQQNLIAKIDSAATRPDLSLSARVPEGSSIESNRPAESPSLKSQEPKVSFFESTSAAKSVAFVVDRSSSMSGRRFERARDELRRSVDRLEPGQEFYVVFFNTQPALLFNESNPKSLARATPSLKKRFSQWLDGIMASGGTDPEDSVRIAAHLRPDVIFLLSDGEFSALSTFTWNLLHANRVVVNTIAYESTGGAKLLQEIADRTDGTYRFVPVNASNLNVDFAAGRLSSENETRLRQIMDGASNKWDLALGAGIPAPSLLEELFELLRDPDPQLRQDVRHVLAFVSDGIDTELPNDADVAMRDAAVQKWRDWYVQKVRDWFEGNLRSTPSRQRSALVVEMLGSPNVHERRAVARHLRSRSVRRTDQLLKLIGDEDREVRSVVRGVLVELAEGVDFGPPDNATEQQREAAVKNWQAWWQERQVLGSLRLAKILAEDRPDAARRKMEEIIQEYSDSKAAAEARVLLPKLPQLAKPASAAPTDDQEPNKAVVTKPSETDEKLAQKKFEFAQGFISENPSIAADLLQKLIQKHPGTKAAEAARQLLEEDAAPVTAEPAASAKGDPTAD